jgi:hypothetical protein
MKKGLFLVFMLSISSLLNAQNNKVLEKPKDTVKTEVVEVITSYNPKIADANKINKNPRIQLLKNSKKEKLKYRIFSAPVASTFIPKTGVVKGIDLGVKERIYQNYVAAGFGNFTTPYFETFLHHKTRNQSEFGLYAKYLSSLDNIQNTALESGYSNFNAGVYYQQENRYFNWKVTLNSELNSYNWYGLPALNFANNTLSSIDENQKYSSFELIGDFKFIDSFFEYTSLSMSYFTDDYKSREILVSLETKLDLPLNDISLRFNDLSIKAGLEFLNGEFKNTYGGNAALKHAIFTANINPEYILFFAGFDIKLGVKTYFSMDIENKSNNIFLLPDLRLEKSIVKNHLTIYGGFSGGLHTNTYNNFMEENPYVSPSLLITQTVEKSNLFIGFKGKITNDISFNLKGSQKNEEDKPLFLRNNSRSNGISTIVNSVPLNGYEYGNSFGVFYEDVKTTSIFAEAEYDFTKKITFSTQLQYDNFELTNALEAWNLPSMQASLLGKYKTNKWYATTNIFYVSERKDALYNAQFIGSIKGVDSINSFVDVNLNGGYHFDDQFSVFLKFNNILNSDYQRFANFDTQGFQVLGGITYKFDF